MKKAYLRLSLIFLIALFVILNANASPEYIQFVIMSGSMRPTFEVGDVITVQTDVNASQIYAAPYPDGDIIAFHPPTHPDEIIIHRAIQKSYVNGTYYFQTKADANPNPDWYEVPEENIIGKVIAYSRTYTAGIWNDIAYNVTLYTNSTISNFNLSQLDKLITFDITGYMSQAENGFCNVTIPKNLLRCESLYEWQVRLNGTNIAHTATQNDTHTFIYFTHSYSTQNIQIIGTEAIPEFPSAVLLTVLMVVTTLNTLFMKRKLKTKLRERFTKKRENIQKSINVFMNSFNQPQLPHFSLGFLLVIVNSAWKGLSFSQSFNSLNRNFALRQGSKVKIPPPHFRLPTFFCMISSRFMEERLKEWFFIIF